ncbi:unnamed protein product [Dibothriocephalus latus]|uniref:Uncharacterized protein n=1 Tax=Dibothriocephalus latus TaxID=60516 RepID=A0A3P7RJP0_DIBLA|nr:unnamed protein product [Dibothriocephalus latus]
MPQHRRYTRANLVSKADRIESAEKRLEQLRGKLAEEAQKAFKQEKKLGVLLGGYQSRAQGLIKAIQDSVDLTEQSRMEFTTLERLREQELGAIARRTEVSPISHIYTSEFTGRSLASYTGSHCSFTARTF